MLALAPAAPALRGANSAGHVTMAVHDITGPVTIMGAVRAITMAVHTLIRATAIIRAGRTPTGATERRGIARTRITAGIRTVVTTTTTRITAVIRTVVTTPATRTTRQPTAIADQRLQLSSSALAGSVIITAQSTELLDRRPVTPSRLFKAEMAWRWMGRLNDRCLIVWGLSRLEQTMNRYSTGGRRTIEGASRRSFFSLENRQVRQAAAFFSHVAKKIMRLWAIRGV